MALAAGAIALAIFSCGDNGATTSSTSSSSSSTSSSSSSTSSSSTGSSSSGTAADRCQVITASIAEAGFAGVASVSCDDKTATISGDTYPAHDKMNGITGTNEQVPVPAPGHGSPIPLVPAPGTAPFTVDGALGVAVNGVPIYDYTAAGMNDINSYDPKSDTKALGQLDTCNGHAGRGDDYHYHAAPTCMMAAMKNEGPAAIIGWALDGYPIYGDENPDGSAIAEGDLDVCNSQADPTFGRRYHTSVAPPYIVQCLVGQVDEATLPRVPPLDDAAGGGKPPGTPPQGGVTNLSFVEGADGTRTMTYDHQGQGYHITYKPSAKAGCWDFEEKTVTNGGVVKQATYCRKP
jgi:hypothetical protein